MPPWAWPSASRLAGTPTLPGTGGSRSPAYRAHLPDLDPVLAVYAAGLKEIARLARSTGARVIFLTQPTLWRPDLSDGDRARLWMGGSPFAIEQPAPEFYSVAALARGLLRFNETLLGVCAELGAECLDVANTMPRDVSVFSDDAHFTERGSRLLADQVASYLLETAPLRRRD